LLPHVCCLSIEGLPFTLLVSLPGAKLGNLAERFCSPVDQLKTFTGVACNERALLYAGNEPSEYDAMEVRCKIRLEEENQGDLVENSTIDFGKLYTIEHNMKIRSIGQVAQMSIRIFDACATLSLEV
jgi:hypothetical protein